MGKVNHPHNTENKHQANGEQCKKPALDKAVYDRLEKKLYLIILP